MVEVIGHSKEWNIAVLLGQMMLTGAQARTVGAVLNLPEEVVMLLQMTPYERSLPMSVPTDPLIHRFYELISVHGAAFKALVHEELGDDIISTIGFSMDLTREPNPKGDRMRTVMSDEFLPCETY